ncbi:MAG: ribosome maturation factor RimM [Myxococcaceae bacterium]
MPTESAQLEVGYVSRAHGLGGEVAVKTFDPSSESLLDLPRLILRGKDGNTRELAVESVRVTGKEILLCLVGVNGRSDAERLVGSTVFAYRDDLEAPAEGEYFQGDLVGLAAVDEAGAPLGTVEEIWDTGPVPNLVIRGGPRGELLVPFADEFVPTVDLEKRLLVVRPPEFLE